MRDTAPVAPGGIIRTVCTTTGGYGVTADVKVDSVRRLACGCWLARCARPGPPGDCPTMDVHMTVCAGRGHHDGAPMPAVIAWVTRAKKH